MVIRDCEPRVTSCRFLMGMRITVLRGRAESPRINRTSPLSGGARWSAWWVRA
jgi:hypothetical protein